MKIEVEMSGQDFYSRPIGMSAGGRHRRRLQRLPTDIPALAAIIQGLFVHEYGAKSYGFKVPESRRRESHLRSLTAIVDRVFALDDRRLSAARPVEKRLIGVCHHPMLLLVGILRAHGVPARGRCGQGAYFNPPFYEDHWICEYWDTTERRWVLADVQFDDVWKRQLKIAHDVLDVPRDRFLVAADAWMKCRRGEADPSKFGIFQGNLRGLWFLAGSLIRDVAALNKREMLPWDVWGAIPPAGRHLTDADLAFFDELAVLTADPDASVDRLVARYKEDKRVRVPTVVFNALRQRRERV